jgi:hypothetical protein
LKGRQIPILNLHSEVLSEVILHIYAPLGHESDDHCLN